jgi:hypothetical protein
MLRCGRLQRYAERFLFVLTLFITCTQLLSAYCDRSNKILFDTVLNKNLQRLLNKRQKLTDTGVTFCFT